MDTIVIKGGEVTVLPPDEYAMVVHPHSECAGRAVCVIHAPTNHHMRSWRLHWRSDRGIFERMCPHGVGHPDPDQWAHWIAVGHARWLEDVAGGVKPPDATTAEEYAHAEMVHGCDGCCRAS